MSILVLSNGAQMNIRSLSIGRAFDLVRSGSFDHLAQIKHQLNAEGHDINDLNDRGLSRGLALRRMYLSRKRMKGSTGPHAMRHVDEVIGSFKLLRWPPNCLQPDGSLFSVRKE